MHQLGFSTGASAGHIAEELRKSFRWVILNGGVMDDVIIWLLGSWFFMSSVICCYTRFSSSAEKKKWHQKDPCLLEMERSDKLLYSES